MPICVAIDTFVGMLRKYEQENIFAFRYSYYIGKSVLGPTLIMQAMVYNVSYWEWVKLVGCVGVWVT